MTTDQTRRDFRKYLFAWKSIRIGNVLLDHYGILLEKMTRIEAKYTGGRP